MPTLFPPPTLLLFSTHSDWQKYVGYYSLEKKGKIKKMENCAKSSEAVARLTNPFCPLPPFWRDPQLTREDFPLFCDRFITFLFPYLPRFPPESTNSIYCSRGKKKRGESIGCGGGFSLPSFSCCCFVARSNRKGCVPKNKEIICKKEK